MSHTVSILLVTLRAQIQNWDKHFDRLSAVWSEHHKNILRDIGGDPRAPRQDRKRQTHCSEQCRQRTIRRTLTLANMFHYYPNYKKVKKREKKKVKINIPLTLV